MGWAGSLTQTSRQAAVLFPRAGHALATTVATIVQHFKTENCRPPKKFCVKPPLLRGVNIVVFLGVTEALIRCCVVACKNVTKLSHTQLYTVVFMLSDIL